MPDVTISRKTALAFHAVVMGDWTDDLNDAMNELDRELERTDPDSESDESERPDA